MLSQNKCLPFHFALFVCALLFISCRQNSNSSPQNYQIGKPEQTILGKVLNEISGITFSAEDSSLLAVSDSKLQVFQLDLKNIKLKDYTGSVIAPDSDMEDIVKMDSSLFLLMSKGILKEIPLRAKDTTGIKTYDPGLKGSNDFETLYYDPTANGLVLLCKSCAHEKGQGIRTAYRFDLSKKTFDTAAFYTISKEDVKAILKNTDVKFDPSAAAIHPANKRLYILSSAGNLLVITDTRGKVIEAYNLNPDTFPQPEGIAFAPNGDMYITNEGKFGTPTLYRFPYHPLEKKK